MGRTLSAILVAAGILSSGLFADDPLLQIVGEPYFGGNIVVHVTAPEYVGQPAALAYGLNPLSPAIGTGKGQWYIGQLFKILQLGNVPAGGRIDLALNMPPETPGVVGLPVVVQAFSPPRLSNPAQLRLDQPYLVAAEAIPVLPPRPSAGANFGDRVEVGDFDDDGAADLAVGASFETYEGIPIAGSVYIMWGPDWLSFTELRPPAPGLRRGFGSGLAAADFDADGIDDLAIAESATDPPDPSDFGDIFLVRGREDRLVVPEHVASSPASGIEGISFGRFLASGDVTGDTIPDLVVGAAATAVGETLFSGALMILPGPTLGPAWVLPNPTPVDADFFGAMVALHDVNGDGHLDILEASDRADVVDPDTEQVIGNAGEVNVGFGPEFTTWQSIHHPIALSVQSRFGNRVDARDLDGDGLAEISATDAHDLGFIFWGDGSTITEIPKPPAQAINPFGDSSFGYALRFSDVNGDAIPDLVVGDPFDGQLGLCSAGDEGMAWVALAPYFSTFTTVFAPNGSCGDEFSWDLELVDLNGDGVSDLVVGAPLADSLGLGNSGAVYILLGGS